MYLAIAMIAASWKIYKTPNFNEKNNCCKELDVYIFEK